MLPWVQHFWDSLSFLDFLEVCFLPRLGKFSFIFCLNKFSISCSSFFFFLHPYDSDVGVFKVVPELSQPLLIFLNSCFFILFWLNVYFFLLLQIVDWSPNFLPFTVVSLYIFLYFTLNSLYFSLYFLSILKSFL